MHQSRKTHNAHNETQRRFARVKASLWFKNPYIRYRGEDYFYKEPSCSFKGVKAEANRRIRRNKNDIGNVVNHKMLNHLGADIWDYI